ncbi:MAG: hypothetical protein ACJAWV_000103 [Flammeovirgaceae bacterium]|jgi:hypothetical protein
MKNRLILFIYLIIAFISGCYESPEDFPNTPIIVFSDITNEFVADGTSDGSNLITVSLQFQDGDGNLGLNSEDRDEGTPFAPTIVVEGDSIANEFNNNYFITVFKIENGDRDSVSFPQGTTYNGAFRRLPTDGNNSAIEGTLNYKFDLLLGIGVQVDDSIDFDIRIADRSFNYSNTVSTSNKVIVLKGN